MKRSKAEEMLDHIRRLLALGVEPHTIERRIRQDHGIEPLEKCSGEAHSNIYIDHCSRCAPRWGVVGERIKIT